MLGKRSREDSRESSPEYESADDGEDATLAAGYSQLAAQALGLSSIWIGMFDEKKVMDVIGTDLIPSSVLCIGYPEQTKFPKPRRNLKDLVHVTW